ncbi:GDSL-like lipase/acylhydrolase family protein [Pseudoduganella lurida]|uniref:GDSL-like lipase/acylhydrolase family protein n=1 Tax=Pseudoduganella lurida TaxID=1036180 RepID=A0A562RE76_9BURK|nr:GDSL-type esterase/lipase family protein [Pseudoduganella lurida]TWI67361.1 GDSL-like lipase/acylhydrolase family protein [Pseudoduganella lurida]
MQSRPRSFAGALALATFLCAGPCSAAVTVAPSDPKLQYTGRIDFADPAAPVLSWPGTGIAGTFTGSTLALKLDDQRGRNYFNVFIDGDVARPQVVHAAKGSGTYTVASGLAAGPHRFLVTKRTEGEEGATVFRGLELADGATLGDPPARPQRRIEFYGDSITSAMGNEAPDDGPDDLPAQKNSFLSYAAIAARAVDAEAHFISKSGIGVMISWFPWTMPQYFDQLDAVDDNASAWDFGRWTPQVVVINLMQNDKWLIDREKRLQPVPDDAERVRRYRAFVAQIRARYPQAHIVCALGSMDATEAGSRWPGYVATAVAQLRQDGDRHLSTLVFPFTGFAKHPRLRHHQANAVLLEKHLREQMGW